MTVLGRFRIEAMAHGASRGLGRTGITGLILMFFFSCLGGSGVGTLHGWDGTMDLRLRLTLASNASIRRKYRVSRDSCFSEFHDRR